MKLKDIVREGIKYSAYSDRGRKVKQEMVIEKRDLTAIPISLLLALGFGLCTTSLTLTT